MTRWYVKFTVKKKVIGNYTIWAISARVIIEFDIWYIYFYIFFFYATGVDQLI